MNNKEIPKYKKRKNNSSKSSKRSDHKHDYQPVIMKGFIVGWIWADKCRICGRVKAKHFSARKELMKPEFRSRPYYCSDFFYSYEELKELYPDAEIVLETPWERLL